VANRIALGAALAALVIGACLDGRDDFVSDIRRPRA
jgi:hypothetical protein